MLPPVMLAMVAPPTRFQLPVAALSVRVDPVLFRLPVRFTVALLRMTLPRLAAVKLPPRFSVESVTEMVPELLHVPSSVRLEPPVRTIDVEFVYVPEIERVEALPRVIDVGSAWGDAMDRAAAFDKVTGPLTRPPDSVRRPPFMFNAVPIVTLLKRLDELLLNTRLLLTMLIVPLSTRTPFMFQMPVESSNVVVRPVLVIWPTHVMVVFPVRVIRGTSPMLVPDWRMLRMLLLRARDETL